MVGNYKTVFYLCIYALISYASTMNAMEKEGANTKNRITVGIDVGGTNTDAVLLSDKKLISKVKTITTQDITTGVVKALSSLLETNGHLREHITSVNIGTTHLLNALLQRKGLIKPLVLRLAAPATTAVPPAMDWAPGLKEELLGDAIHILPGGYEFNGQEISPLDSAALEHLAKQSKENTTQSVAITGVFANVNPAQEERVKALFKHYNPEIEVSLSHTMGDLGLLARENATILNACLIQQYHIIRKAFKEAVEHLGVKAPVFLTYGDGTKTRLDDSSTTPLRTLNSGPINSIKGAASIAQVKDAVTVDIGGTSSDVGLLKDGEPVNENSRFALGGITCNFSSARLHSFALGGGSIIKIGENKAIEIGPESVGKDFSERALVYGGDILTPTDIAVVLGRLSLGTLDSTALKRKISHFAQSEDVDSFIKRVDAAVHEKLVCGIIHIIDALEDSPSTLVLVGGGATLFDLQRLKELMPQFRSLIVPQCSDVANALGAAMSLIGGTYVNVYDYAKVPRPDAVADATEKAKRMAITKGAEPESIKVVAISDIPLSYLVGDPNQLTVSVVGADSGNYSLAAQEPTVALSVLDQVPRLLATKSVRTETESKPQESLKPRVQLHGIETLTALDVNDIAAGSGLLGSGGGGNPEFGRQLALYTLRNGAKIQKISFENLPDDALTIVFGGVGSPAVSSERLPAIDEGIKAIQEMEKKLGRHIDALVLGEIGGSNATEPLFVAASLGIPVVDCDCMGRALPGIDMSVPCIYGAFDEYCATLSNGGDGILIQADDKSFASLEDKVRKIVVEMGGTASMAELPMTGAQVKKWTIKGTLSIAQALGKALRLSQGEPFSKRLEALNKVLAITDYKKAEKIGEGKIIYVRRRELGGFSVGGFIVEDHHTKEKLEVGFQNENLIARKQSTREILAQVPHLITVIDKNTFQTISCEDLRYGQDVVILTMKAPALIATEKALTVVGPHAFPMKQIFELLNSHTLAGERFSS